MKFRGLEIKRETFGDNKGKFAGRIHFESNNKDSIYLNIDPEYAKKIYRSSITFVWKSNKWKDRNYQRGVRIKWITTKE